MSPQPPSPGANTAAQAASGEEAAGSPPVPVPPPEEAPRPAAGPETEAVAAPAGDSATTTAPPPSSAGAPEEGIGLATAAGTAPGARTGTGVDGGRPRTPILAGAAFLGAALVAIPLLLVGSANDREQESTAVRPAAEGAGTVLDPDSAPAAIEDYVAGTASASPGKEKPGKTRTPQAAAPAPAPEPGTGSPAAEKPKATPKATPKAEPKSKPKPKAAPEPDWSTVTFSAPSVLQVNQAWTTNRIRMVMQTDGNLVVLNEQGKPIWASMTFGENHRAIFQPDGNLVIHNGDDRAIWASRTHDHAGARLVLRADAKVVIVHDGRVVWST
ncbi:mannose-binding protein [Streptomyces sp. ALB3]|uniref:mannose-binding protein n=1 Tax=Streptomyces sp. ALB3 TaxID=3374278 RepID=UPI0037B64C82